MRPNARIAARGVYEAKARREPLEILAILAGRSNYMVPVEGRSTTGPSLTPMDVAHALAASPEKLGAAMGLAIACQRRTEWPRVNSLSYPRLIEELEHQRARPGVIAGALRFRVRLVLWDAYQNLIAPTKRLPMKLAAKMVEMDEGAYRFLHKHITGFLYAAACTAAVDAIKFLFSEHGIAGQHTINDDEIDMRNAIRLPSITQQRRESVSVDMLLAEIANEQARTRRPGMLTLSNNVTATVAV